MGDNGSVPIVPRALIDQAKLAVVIAVLERKLYPDVVRIKHSIGDDWGGDSAIHFRVVLSDAASEPERLHAVTSRVRELIDSEVDPLNSWGLLSYVRFRSQSEQAMLQEPAWA